MYGIKSNKNGKGSKGRFIGNRVYGFGATAYRVAPGPCEVFKTYKDEDKANVLFPDFKNQKVDYIFAGNSALGGSYGIWLLKYDVCT
jgi:hypothetical protein